MVGEIKIYVEAKESFHIIIRTKFNNAGWKREREDEMTYIGEIEDGFPENKIKVQMEALNS